jgi:hypothetical protein
MTMKRKFRAVACLAIVLIASVVLSPVQSKQKDNLNRNISSFQSRIVGRWISVKYEHKESGSPEYPGEDVAVKVVYSRTSLGRGVRTFYDYEEGISKDRYQIIFSDGHRARLLLTPFKRGKAKPEYTWLTFTAEGTLLEKNDLPFNTHWRRVKTKTKK